MKFSFYNEKEFDMFLNSLPLKERTDILNLLVKITHEGMLKGMQLKLVKKLDDGLYEARAMKHSFNDRVIYFKFVGDEYVISHAFKKKTKKTPHKELEKAKSRKRLFKEAHKNDGIQ